jgi:hypothetical protein
VVALVAPELEESFLQAFDNKEVGVVPLVVVLLEESRKCLLWGPLNTNPLQSLRLSVLPHKQLVLDWELAVDVVFDLLNTRVSLILLLRLLEPICHFENVPLLQLLIPHKRLKVSRSSLWLHLPRLEVLPVEDLFVRED